MSNPSGEGSSEYHGSGDGLQERPLVGRVVAWPRVQYLIYEGSAAEARRFLESDMA